MDDHRGRGGLAVRARDRQAALQRADLPQQLAAVQLALAGPPGCDPLGIVGRDRGRVHELGAVRDVRRVVVHGRFDAGRAQLA